jgi:hypothetical protein
MKGFRTQAPEILRQGGHPAAIDLLGGSTAKFSLPRPFKASAKTANHS